MNVKVYSTPTCPYCRRVKEFLKENNVSFEDIDVSLSQEAAQKMVEKSGQMGVPVIMVDDNVIIGFNREKLSKFLNIK